MTRKADGIEVRGVGVDGEGRCAHHGSVRDVVAIQFPCCGRFYACHACHAEEAGHAAERWPRNAFGHRAVFCGACRARVTIRAYLQDPSQCPRCETPFNPGCRKHHPLYFDRTPEPEAPAARA